MGWIIFFAILWFISWIWNTINDNDSSSSSSNTYRSNNTRSSNSYNQRQIRNNRERAAQARLERELNLEDLELDLDVVLREKKEKDSFRPSARKTNNPNITFKTAGSGFTSSTPITTLDLSGLNDAFTGAPLDRSLGLYQCQDCKVYYHTESYEVIKAENNLQCMACNSKRITAILDASTAQTGRNHTPDIVTLSNFKDYVGSVVTFESYVYRVYESRRGNDFAVMFENKRWVEGFKLVFFKGAVRKVGGAPYINSLKGKKVRVRGLLIEHPTFGYEIIVSQKSMILSVR